MKRAFNFGDWLPWEQNASPFFLLLTLKAGMVDLPKRIGAPLWTSVIIFEDRQAKWLFRPKELKMLGQRMIDYLMCPPLRVAFFTAFDQTEQQVLQRAEEIQARDLATSDDAALLSLYDEFCSIYCKWYSYGWFCEPIQFQSQDLIDAYLQKEAVRLQLSGSAADARQALFAIQEDSFTVEILRDLRECAARLGVVLRDPAIYGAVKARQGSEHFPEQAANVVLAARGAAVESLNEALTAHADRFFWKRNNYYSTTRLTKHDVLKELLSSPDFNLDNASATFDAELSRIREGKATMLSARNKLLCLLPAYLQNLAALVVSVGGHLLDRRKRTIMIANAAFDRILAEVAQRAEMPLVDIRLLAPEELAYFLREPKSYTARFTERREMLVVFQADLPLLPDLFGNLQPSIDRTEFKAVAMVEPFLAEGATAELTLEQLNQQLYFLAADTSEVSTAVVRGVSAYFDPAEPLIEGRVCVVRDPKKQGIQQGDILVAPSTTPDYMESIRRCKAIITDWGGQTSHAAITARELRKPCIIGTNYASQVLATGALVRLDLEKGVVTLLKNTNAGA